MQLTPTTTAKRFQDDAALPLALQACRAVSAIIVPKQNMFVDYA